MIESYAMGVAMSACANHPETSAAARCGKCRTALCDPCSAFLINDAAWCEPCGNEEVESGKGHPVVAIVVLAVLFVGWLGLMAVQLFVIRRVWFWTIALVIVPFGVAWPIAYPPTTGEKPIIVDRRVRRVPLPASARRSL